MQLDFIFSDLDLCYRNFNYIWFLKTKIADLKKRRNFKFLIGKEGPKSRFNELHNDHSNLN